MDIRILKYFLAIASEESISKAATMLHLTQPTLSRQLQELEEELTEEKKIKPGKQGRNQIITKEEIINFMKKN